ncbi:CCR4-NOT transcription complex subunit 4 [Operophtera brumata]|uniref:CCR4-NOT transcription complex subunit 4 n=1 Tax=Operophtera brumata TaxID=104452 RepID=A0A0L7LS82_OPEBR|nr:CCR4-NOT transcription complex subunit 4 [Operophtera brumata]
MLSVQVAAIKTEKKAREQKRRNKTLESRRALANVRVVQKNLVFVLGLPILKRQEYFGKYGKIHKVVINQNNTYAGAQVR